MSFYVIPLQYFHFFFFFWFDSSLFCFNSSPLSFEWNPMFELIVIIFGNSLSEISEVNLIKFDGMFECTYLNGKFSSKR